MTRSPLAFLVADLHHRPGARRRERASVDLAGIGLSSSSIPAAAEVDVDVVLESVPEGILVSGTVVAPWRGECRRCLAPVAGEARSELRELFEAQPTEGETWLLRDEEIDLEPLVRESLLLELPLAPLCREECLGLCPSCGADLNQGPCACEPAPRDPRWAALDALRPEDQRSKHQRPPH